MSARSAQHRRTQSPRLAAAGRPSRGPRWRPRSLWGSAALLGWLALALHASGLVSLDMLHPASLTGCAGSQLQSVHIPPAVSHGLTLQRGEETVHLPRGAMIDWLGTRLRLVGADRAANVIVLEGEPTVRSRAEPHASTRLVGVPLTNNTLVVKRISKGGRIAAIIVSGVGGLAAGMAAGAVIGANTSGGGSSSGGGNVGGMVLGCLGGGVLLGGLGAGTTALATRSDTYVLAPGQWQIVEEGR